MKYTKMWFLNLACLLLDAIYIAVLLEVFTKCKQKLLELFLKYFRLNKYVLLIALFIY